MAAIGVAHTDLAAKGGGEGVCMCTLEALQDRHDVTLLTITRPDLDELNRYYRTDVAPLEIRHAPRYDALLNEVDLPLYNLRNALLNRFVGKYANEFDAIVGTDNELSLDVPTVQYIHTPRFGRLVTTKRVGEDSFVDHFYDRLSWRVGGFDAERIAGSELVTNSRWMANVVQDAYDTRPEIVHPPVDTSGFEPRPWGERENGFVTIGRLARYKRIERAIRIVDGVRERGHDVHLHVIGPSYDEEYRCELDAMADRRDYIAIEGELPREELVEMICSHRYGLHAKRREHFGMAIAELVAGGAIPFVPDASGQRDIVNERDEQLYGTVEEAVDRIDEVLATPSLQSELRSTPEAIERRFGRERFREEMRDAVERALEDADAAGSASRAAGRRGRPPAAPE